jgi:trans-aconitate 2-methyltransferase
VTLARYTFGDGDVAADRLALVASVFEPTSRRLMAAAPDAAARAVDLGCGPGHTTRLLAEVTGARATLGLDASSRFVDLARATHGAADPSLTFAVHDATVVPLPGGPADVVHARLLLAHLPEPLAVVERWRSALRPGGVLLLDEVAAIAPPAGVLRDYLDLVTAQVAAGGADMYAGRLLAPLGGEDVCHPVDATVAARMFGLNLVSWGDDAVRRGLVGPADVERLAGGLAAVRAGTVVWTLSHAVLTPWAG